MRRTAPKWRVKLLEGGVDLWTSWRRQIGVEVDRCYWVVDAGRRDAYELRLCCFGIVLLSFSCFSGRVLRRSLGRGGRSCAFWGVVDVL